MYKILDKRPDIGDEIIIDASTNEMVEGFIIWNNVTNNSQKVYYKDIFLKVCDVKRRINSYGLSRYTLDLMLYDRTTNELLMGEHTYHFNMHYWNWDYYKSFDCSKVTITDYDSLLTI